MLCNDQQLQILLGREEQSDDYRRVASHVESCARCQSRLDTLVHQDTDWWLEAKASWTEEPLPEPDSNQRTHSIVIELDREGLGDDAIDFEPVRLDFLQRASHPELLGRLGRYEIERVIGQGGMGVVLKGFDTELHRVVAIKVLAPHLAHRASARRRFSREAQAAAAVVHPHVIPIFDVESETDLPYLVMQYVAGHSLQSRVDERGPLPVEEALRIAQQTAAGLAAAHGQGLVHRDVKPANILLEESVDRVLLSDFGLARAVDDASLTRTGVITGTPFYMSPEQARGGAIDTRSDLFSLGSVLYFMLTGHSPFRTRGAMAVLNRICVENPRPIQEINPLVPWEVSELVERLLAKLPADRVQTAQQVEETLAMLLTQLQSGSLTLRLRPQRRRLRLSQSGRWMALSMAALVVCMFLIGAYLLSRPGQPLGRSISGSPDVSISPSTERSPLTVRQLRAMQSEVMADAQQSDAWWELARRTEQMVAPKQPDPIHFSHPVTSETKDFQMRMGALWEAIRSLLQDSSISESDQPSM